MGEAILFPTPSSLVVTDDAYVNKMASILETSRDSLTNLYCADLTDDELDQMFRQVYDAFTAALNLLAIFLQREDSYKKELAHFRYMVSSLSESSDYLGDNYINLCNKLISIGGNLSAEEATLYDYFMTRLNNADKENRPEGENS